MTDFKYTFSQIILFFSYFALKNTYKSQRRFSLRVFSDSLRQVRTNRSMFSYTRWKMMSRHWLRPITVKYESRLDRILAIAHVCHVFLQPIAPWEWGLMLTKQFGFNCVSFLLETLKNPPLTSNWSKGTLIDFLARRSTPVTFFVSQIRRHFGAREASRVGQFKCRMCFIFFTLFARH